MASTGPVAIARIATIERTAKRNFLDTENSFVFHLSATIRESQADGEMR
jgi:hypothetical protein